MIIQNPKKKIDESTGKEEEEEVLELQREYREEEGGIVLQHFNLFLSIFHSHSIAAIIMDKSHHFSYLERVIHTGFNTGSYTIQQEAQTLSKLASFKGGGSF